MRQLRHVDPHAPRGVLYRAYARLVGTRPMGWVSRKVGWKLDPLLLRLTGGRLGTGLLLPTALLETRGARTGRTRRNPVIYFHDGERVTIVASKLGMPENPSWFHNLRANPDVVFGGRPFRAEVVSDDAERTRLWALADRVFPSYATYRERAALAGRTIPIVRLVPSRSHASVASRPSS
jgi:deazaflavin-dependent oxidoreductase (nitroreductase family)